MPYILKEHRPIFDEITNELQTEMPNPGDLNYVITKILQIYAKEHGIKYATLNEIIGVLECCKQELYRKLVAPYEDKKIEENGDVY